MAQANLLGTSRRPMCNSYGSTWAICCLFVLLRAMQSRTDNCMTAIQLNDEVEVSLFVQRL
jgi:hypothetical protein